MSNQNLNISNLRKYIKDFKFSELFIESLGWDNPTGQIAGKIQLNGQTIPYSYIAEKSGVPILQFDLEWNSQFDKKKFHQKIKERHTKFVVLFSVEKTSFSLSYLLPLGKIKSVCKHLKNMPFQLTKKINFWIKPLK